MRTPGALRSAEDRTCDVLCSCGAVAFTLGPGQRVITAQVQKGKTVDVRCPKCGTSVRLRYTDEQARS